MVPEEVRVGSAAQLKGELTQDFTAQCRETLLESLRDAISRIQVEDEEDNKDLDFLLVSLDPEVVLLALDLRHAYSWCHSGKYFKELSCSGWAGDEEPLDLIACIHGCSTPEGTRVASSLHFEFYGGEGKLQTIDVGMEELQSQGENGLLLFNRLVREFAVPEDLRFALLNRIRFAKAFPSTATRHDYVKILLRSIPSQRFSQEDVRDVATSREFPESLRAAALAMCASQGKQLFSRKERDAVVHAFLAGDKGRCSDEFMAALLKYSGGPLQFRDEDRKHRAELPLTGRMFDLLSPDEVLMWLEDELDDPERSSSTVVGDVNLRQKQMIVKGLLNSITLLKKLTSEQTSRLNGCLVKVLDDSYLLERRSLQWDNNSDSLIQLSLVGWKIIEGCLEFFGSIMQDDARSKVVGLVLGGMPNIPERLLDAALNSHVALELLQVGGVKFLEQLPLDVIGTMIILVDHRYPVDDSTFETMAKKLADDLGREPPSPEHCEKLVCIMNCLLHAGGFLKAVVKTGAADELLETVRRLSSRWSPASGTLLKRCFCVIRDLVEHGSRWEQHTDGTRMKHRILDTVFYALRHCDITKELRYHADIIISFLCSSAADGDIRRKPHRDKHGLQIPPPPLPEMIDLLLKLGSKKEQLLIRVIWTKAGRHARELTFALLVDHLDHTEDAAAAAWIIAAVVGDDAAATAAARKKAAASKFLELVLSPGSGEVGENLVPVLDELLRREDGNPFAGSELSEEEHRKALVWFRNRLNSADQPGRQGENLLQLGESLTSNDKLAMELIDISAGDLASLFRGLIERSFLGTVQYLLEDHDMIYNSMVQKIQEFFTSTECSSAVCEVGEFLEELWDLAHREPTVFMQASVDTCEVYAAGDEQQKYMIALRDRDIHKGGGQAVVALTRHFREVFAVLLDVAKVTNLGLRALATICDKFPGAVDLVLSHGSDVLDCAMKAGDADGATRFLAKVAEHNERVVAEAAARFYHSCPEVKELNARWILDASGVDRIVGILSSLDLDRPDAAKVAGNLLLGLTNFSSKKERVVEGKSSPYPKRPCIKKPSERAVEEFYIRQKAIAQASIARRSTGEVGEIHLEDGREEDGEGLQQQKKWMIDEEKLESLVKLLWISAGNCSDQLGPLLEKHTDHAQLSRILVSMLLRPGALRAYGSPGNGLWYCNPIGGVPGFVANRVVDILHALADRHSFSLLDALEEDDAVSFITLMLKHTVSTKKLLEVIRLPATISSDAISKLCELCALHESAGDVLASLITMHPVIMSRMAAISSQLIGSTLEKLRAGDHTSDFAVLRFVRAFDRVVAMDGVAAREELKLALDALWIHTHDHRSSRELIQALFLAQTFSSGPTDTALNELMKEDDRNLEVLLNLIAGFPRFVAEQVIDILHGLFDLSLLPCIDKDNSVSFIALMLCSSLIDAVRKPEWEDSTEALNIVEANDLLYKLQQQLGSKQPETATPSFTKARVASSLKALDPTIHEIGVHWFGIEFVLSLNQHGIPVQGPGAHIAFAGSATRILNNGRRKEADGSICYRPSWAPSVIWEIAVWNESWEELQGELFEWTSGQGEAGANVAIGVKVFLTNNRPVIILACMKERGRPIRTVDISPQIPLLPRQVVFTVSLAAILNYTGISRRDPRSVTLDLYFLREHLMHV